MIRDVRAGAALLMFAAAATLPPMAQAILLAVAWMLPHLLPSVFSPATPQRWEAWRRLHVFAMLFVIVSVVVQGVFGPGPRLEIPMVPLSVEGLETGLGISLRAVLVLTGIFVTLMSMEPLELAHWLTRLRLPIGIPVAILLSLQLVEDLPETIRRIRSAQRSRGLRIEGNLPTRLRALRFLITPVVMRSLEGSLERATALQLRGLLEPLPLERRRTPFGTLGFLLGMSAVLLILYRILVWTGHLPPIA